MNDVHDLLSDAEKAAMYLDALESAKAELLQAAGLILEHNASIALLQYQVRLLTKKLEESRDEKD